MKLSLLVPFSLIACLFVACGSPQEESIVETPAVDPMAEESFFMRNEEILEAILARLERENIEHWLKEDGSVGFYARDTETVDAIANAEIGNWVTLQ
ncbi:MAG: hypothetical protein MI746_01680 [Pseudomonadales bacterium]|nr:hypothetical protein [Pseudomonadales bacterium]